MPSCHKLDCGNTVATSVATCNLDHTGVDTRNEEKCGDFCPAYCHRPDHRELPPSQTGAMTDLCSPESVATSNTDLFKMKLNIESGDVSPPMLFATDVATPCATALPQARLWQLDRPPRSRRVDGPRHVVNREVKTSRSHTTSSV